MKNLILFMGMILVSTQGMAAAYMHPRDIPADAEIIQTCQNKFHKVDLYRCPFGFCYGAIYDGQFGYGAANGSGELGKLTFADVRTNEGFTVRVLAGPYRNRVAIQNTSRNCYTESCKGEYLDCEYVR